MHHIPPETTTTGPHAPTRRASTARWRHILPAALCAAAVALTAPAIASAAPRELDIEAYDECQNTVDQDYFHGRIHIDEYERESDLCCVNAGGTVLENHECAAPPCDCDNDAEHTVPPVLNLPPGVVPQATLAPVTPAPIPRVVSTTPAPISRG